MKIRLINVPVENGGNRPGTGMGPQAFHEAGIQPFLESFGHTVLVRDVPIVGSVLSTMDTISLAGYIAMDAGDLPIFLGGDHSISIGSINGIAQYAYHANRPLYVLWMDAHADFNTPDTSITGNLHGMAAAFVCGEFSDPKMFNRPYCRYPVPLGQLMLWGTRILDTGEHDLIKQRNVSMNEGKLGDWIEKIKAVNGILHLSFDMDYLDPSLAPGVGTPVPNGASLQSTQNMFKIVRESGLLCSMDLVELNPTLDKGETVSAAMNLINTLFGSEPNVATRSDKRNNNPE